MNPEAEQALDELKACPFCGSSNTTLDYYEISCPQELGTIVICNDCGASAKSIVDWNTRPIEDALRARIAELTAENAELRDVIGDYRNDASRVLDEKCPSDERHCGCVPILRDQLNKYQKALILITTMPELSQATTIAREALQERGKFIWTEQSVGEYWVTKLDILQDKFDTLEKDYADVCQKRLEAADVFSRQIIELESENAELEAAQRWIPVSERLPEEGHKVLVLLTDGAISIDLIYGNDFLYENWVGDITHWMPLPQPPEVQE